jgi:hypothetical protein
MGGQTDRLAGRQAGRELVGRRMSIVEASLDMMLGDSSAEDTSLTSAMYANGLWAGKEQIEYCLYDWAAFPCR